MPSHAPAQVHAQPRRLFSQLPTQTAAEPLLDQATLDRLLNRVLVEPSPARSARVTVGQICRDSKAARASHALATEGGVH